MSERYTKHDTCIQCLTEWRQKHKNELGDLSNQWQKRNRAHMREYHRQWREKNAERWQELMEKSAAQRRKNKQKKNANLINNTNKEN